MGFLGKFESKKTRAKIFTAKDAKSAKQRWNINNELNANSYELWFKYF